MILTCPSCTRRFVVEDTVIDVGREVSCVLCHHTWYQELPSRKRNTSIENNLKLSPLPLPPKKTRSWGWPLYGLAVSICLTTALLGRDALVNSYPPLKLFYDTIGAQTKLDSGFVHLEKVKASYVTTQGKPKLVISGSIVNTSEQSITIPSLNVYFLTKCSSPSLWQMLQKMVFQYPEDRCLKKFLRVKFSETVLLPGQRHLFETPPVSPIEDGASAIISF